MVRRSIPLLLVGGLLLLTLGAAILGSVSETASPVARAGPARCQAGQLALNFTNTGNGGGSVIWVGTFVNRSSRSCSLKGFPSLYMVGDYGNPMPTTPRDMTGLRPSPETSPKEIDLGPQASASFVVEVSDGAQSLPSLPACPPAASLTVTPPGDSRGIQVGTAGFIAYPYDKGGLCGVVYVGAIIAGPAQRALCPACFPADKKQSTSRFGHRGKPM